MFLARPRHPFEYTMYVYATMSVDVMMLKTLCECEMVHNVCVSHNVCECYDVSLGSMVLVLAGQYPF